jgi:hypothetical protein
MRYPWIAAMLLAGCSYQMKVESYPTPPKTAKVVKEVIRDSENILLDVVIAEDGSWYEHNSSLYNGTGQAPRMGDKILARWRPAEKAENDGK